MMKKFSRFLHAVIFSRLTHWFLSIVLAFFANRIFTELTLNQVFFYIHIGITTIWLVACLLIIVFGKEGGVKRIAPSLVSSVLSVFETATLLGACYLGQLYLGLDICTAYLCATFGCALPFDDIRALNARHNSDKE